MSSIIKFEGASIDEILAFSDQEIDGLILCDQPIVFHAGSAEVLGKFKISGKKLVLELAQIDGGGEGVLPSIAVLSKRIAQHRKLEMIEWIVHAVNCAKPNPKLRRVLVMKGFEIEDIPDIGKAYHKIINLTT